MKPSVGLHPPTVQILTDVAGVAAAAPVIEETALSQELAQLEAELENA
jgi:hypothetical protein